MSSVQHHNHHRAWMPLVLTGAVLLIIIAVFAWKEAKTARPIDTSRSSAQNLVAQEELKSSYQTQLNQAFIQYRDNGSREELLDLLLTVRVPADYLNMHVTLVIDADDIDFSQDALDTRIENLRAEYFWLE